jgi:hypothetical protein
MITAIFMDSFSRNNDRVHICTNALPKSCIVCLLYCVIMGVTNVQ